jgi:arginase family enzyme
MHGTPFRRAVEEGLIDPRRVVMIGMRGTTYDSEDRRFADSADIRVIPIEEYFRRDIEDVMVEARAIVADRPTRPSTSTSTSGWDLRDAKRRHEIRTPMNGVLGMVEVLELRFLHAAAQTRIVSMARIRLACRKSVRPFNGIFCDDF